MNNVYGIVGEIQQLVTFITKWVTKKHRKNGSWREFCEMMSKVRTITQATKYLKVSIEGNFIV